MLEISKPCCDLTEAKESAKKIIANVPRESNTETGAVLRTAEKDTHELRSYLPYASSAIAAARAVDTLLEALSKGIKNCDDLDDLMPQYSAAEAEGREHRAWLALSRELHEQGLRGAEESRVLEMVRLQRGPVREAISLIDTAWRAGRHPNQGTDSVRRNALVIRLIIATEEWLMALCAREVVVAALGAVRESDQMSSIVDYALSEQSLAEGPLQMDSLAGSTAALADSMKNAGHHIEARRVERVANALAEALLASKHREARLNAARAARIAAVSPATEAQITTSHQRSDLHEVNEATRLVLMLERGGLNAIEACVEYGEMYVSRAQKGNLTREALHERCVELTSMAVCAWLVVQDDATARAAQQVESQALMLGGIQSAEVKKRLAEAEAAKAWARPQVHLTHVYAYFRSFILVCGCRSPLRGSTSQCSFESRTKQLPLRLPFVSAVRCDQAPWAAQTPHRC